jgi:uncharacterized repeat protein (TIGR03803 family)
VSKPNTQQFCPATHHEVNIMKILRMSLIIVLIVGAGQAFDANALSEAPIYTFGFPPDGANPQAGLVQGSDGNFYGTTSQGGTNVCQCGTVFRISPGGVYSNLSSFGGFSTDGQKPVAGLVQGNDGNFYGTTEQGGYVGCNCGVLFRITPTGSRTNLHQFGAPPVLNDGNYPSAALVQGSDGNFYGTAGLGGISGNGTVFRISSTGTYSNLYSFGGSPDGRVPSAGLAQGSDGNLYGTTAGGGTTTNGIVFRISSTGTYSNLYSFGNLPDGSQPYGALVQGSDGNFYGTTLAGGTTGNGTVFRISPSGTYSNLHSFGSFPTDGKLPQAGLVQGSDGNFYGTTQLGGSTNLNNGVGYGTVFRISSTGAYASLYSFGNLPDGEEPYGGLIQGSDGNFYGTTFSGGAANEVGTVFRLSVLLSPPPWPINQITNVLIAATNIVFAVPSIAGETYQLQFSNSMNPTNWVNVSSVSVTNSIGALLTLTNIGGAVGPQGFYRFAVTP